MLHILIDSGSTQNFLDSNAAKKLVVKYRALLQDVAVADGNHLACQNMCKNFKWQLQKQWLNTDVMFIPLGSYDMVGIQWLKTLASVKWDLQG